MLGKKVAIALGGLLCLLPCSAWAAGVVISTPIGAPLKMDGTGLCIATAISKNVAADFGNLNVGNYTGSLNTFMEAHAADRIESVIRTLLDLSNNNSSGLQSSYGDFTNVMSPMCKIGGCDFIVNDTTTSFGSRLRGFLNITPDLAGKPMHFGLYTDDAVSLTFFGKSGAIFPVITRPPQLGLPTWRVTNAVTFGEAGLYPLEILYVEIAEHAALELSYTTADFKDFEAPANQIPVTRLSDVGFVLFPPKDFSQTVSGQQSFPDISTCKQCDRQFVNLPGNNGCKLGYYCNEAALCAPCDSAALCGLSCSPCGGTTPFCININGKLDCGQCRTDFDCKEGFSCDAIKHICNECNDDADCPRANACVDHTCQPCDTPDKCAGNSCNCCPKGNNAKQTACAPLEAGGLPVCIECVTTADCAKGACDQLTGLCVDELNDHEQATCCGDDCVHCPPEVPFCLPGHIGTACAACRSDIDCKDGQYCLSGRCELCDVDRRCGARCDSCGGDKPFCTPAQLAEKAFCVRCTKDDECVGGKCDPETHACTSTCPGACPPAQPYCDGKVCVECYADTQCPCGATCQLDTHTCSPSCKTNGDCNGDEHCRYADDGESKECTPGPMMDDSTCGSTLASACGGSTIGRRGEDPLPIGGIVGLSLLALGMRRLRPRGGRS